MKLNKNAIVAIVIAVLVGISLIVVKCARAEGISDLISKFPITNAGIYYNINDSEFEFISTFKALGYRGFNLNIGYATPESLVANIGYDILRFEKLGIDIPILKDLVIDVGWAVGWEEPLNDREFNNGPNITLKWKW